MLNEILAISGKPGLYRLVSRGNNLLVVESLADKKRMPAYTRDKVISLGDISVYTDEEEVSIRQVFTAIKEKEKCGKVSIELSNAQPDELRAYMAEILPNFDRDRVYVSDIKKMLKWYEILFADGITDFIEQEESADAVDDAKTEEDAVEEKETKKVAMVQSATKIKRKESDIAAKPTSVAKATKAPNTIAPKKHLGAKRGG